MVVNIEIYLVLTLCLVVAATPPSYDEYFTKDMLLPSTLKSHLSAQYTSKKGSKVYVFDGVLHYSLLMAGRTFFSSNDNWRYVLFDKYVADPTGTFDHGNGIPWKSWQNPTVLSGTRIGHTLKALLETVSPGNATDTKQKREFHMTEIYSAVLRRGDVTHLHRDAKENDTEPDISYSMVMYTNTIWRKNSYGEMLFYEDDDDFDVFAVISPHCGRIVVWDSSVRYLARPPSAMELAGQYLIFAQFHSDPQVVFERRTYFDKYLYQVKESRNKDFVCTDGVENVPRIDMEKHLTLRRYNKAGESVAVFDGLFNKTDLDELRTYTIKYAKYYYDDHLDLTSDNVQWIAGFEVDKFVKSRFWPVISQVAAYVSGKNTWFPYDIACNLIRSADHTRFHLDTSDDDEEEITFLLYLSPNWTAANYGETAFMELNYDSPENEYVTEVVPMYGRAVIFGGNFPHSAHPPAPDYGGPRYTLAVKLSPTKYDAMLKTFEEETRHSTYDGLQVIKEVKTNPTFFAKFRKVQVVASYLLTKQVQNTIEKNPKKEFGFDQERENAKLNTDQDEYDLSEFMATEDQVRLNKEGRDTLIQMMKYHAITNLANDEGGDSVDEEVSAPDFSIVESTEDRVKSWRKLCGGDAECLNDYLRLLIKQQIELQERLTRDFLSVI